MLYHEDIRATSLVDTKTLGVVLCLAEVAYAGGHEDAAEAYRRGNPKDINQSIAAKLPKALSADMYHTAIRDYGEYSFGLFVQGKNMLAFDAAWQTMLMLKKPSFIKTMRARKHGQIEIPKILIGTPSSMARAAHEYGIPGSITGMYTDADRQSARRLTGR